MYKGEKTPMKKMREQAKKALCMILILAMVLGSLSGCGFGKPVTETAVSEEAAGEVGEIRLNAMEQDAFLLSAGEKPEVTFETKDGILTEVAITPQDKELKPYSYYRITVTLTAKENQSFTKKTKVSLEGVTLTVKEWSKEKMIAEYTALALPETVTTEAMSAVKGYGSAKNEASMGTAKIQALLPCELTLFSEDGKKTYTVKEGFVPLFMVPSFITNEEPEQIKDGKKVQLISDHGEEDFPGAQGQWYKIAADGKVGYVPASFIKDVKVTSSTENKEAAKKPEAGGGQQGNVGKTADKATEKPITKPAVNPVSNQNNQTENTGSDNGGNNTGSNTGGGSSSGGNTGTTPEPTVYYEVSFALGNGISGDNVFLPESLMVRENSPLSLDKLATPSLPGYLFEAWYYDSAYTRQVQSGDTITSNVTLYARFTELTGEEVAQGVANYVSTVDVSADSFTVIVLKPVSGQGAAEVEAGVKLRNLADPEAFLPVQATAGGTIIIEGKEYEKYTISSAALEGGCTYQLELLEDNCVFYYEDRIQPAVVRLYNFTTQMGEVEELQLSSGLIYLSSSEVSYAEGSEGLSGLFEASVVGDTTELNSITGKGSFTYSGSEAIEVGSTVVIYTGAEAPILENDGGELSPAEQYDGQAAYLTISKIEGSTYFYGVADAEDVLFTPDVLPVNRMDDEDGADNNTLTIKEQKLTFTGADYAEMGLDENTTIDVGDFIGFYEGSLETAKALTYGKITEVKVSGENLILTYEPVTEEVVYDAMAVYSTEEMEFELDEDTAAAIEAEMEQDAIDSGFAEEAANYLSELVLETEGYEKLQKEMGLQAFTYSYEEAPVIPMQKSLRAARSSSVQVEGLVVSAKVQRQLKKLNTLAGNNGARAELGVRFTLRIGSGESVVRIKVNAVFEQEVLLNINIKGNTLWGKKWIFPYIKDYQITTNLDVGTYTGITVTADITTDDVSGYPWKDTADEITSQIQELIEDRDKFFGNDLNGGGLAEKYAELMKNDAEWVDLVEVKIFSTEAKILAGIIIVGVQGDFVVSAKVNIMLGMHFDYSVAKRYTFTIHLFAKTSSSDSLDLKKSEYNFDMYVMGTIGIRAGVRLTVYVALFSKKVAAIGVSAEAGAYLQLWGYFFYSTGTYKETTMSAALLLELGAYLEIRFLATALGGIAEYNPILYDHYWPLWSLGSVENVYGFGYESILGEKDDKDIDLGANTGVALPADRMRMAYMDLQTGALAQKGYTYQDFNITATGNFAYENGVVRVIPGEGSWEETGTLKLEWKGAKLSFTDKPISCELDLYWSDPARKRTVSYELYGGTAAENGVELPQGIPSVNVVAGGSLTEPAVELTKEGYTFGGWYTDMTYATAWNFAADRVTENMVLHAKWIPKQYTITYELNGGSNAEGNPDSYVTTEGTPLQAPVKPGYVFEGWYLEAGFDTKVTEISLGSKGDKTLYAKWVGEDHTYEIHYLLESMDGSGYEEAEVVTGMGKTDEVITLTTEQKKGYEGFTYEGDLAADITGIIPVEGTLVFELMYRRSRYEVILVYGNGTEASTESLPYGSTISNPGTPEREGYTFTGWYDGEGVWDFAANVITANTELRAGWDAKEYNVTLDAQGGIGGDNGITAVYDSELPEASMPARTGYTFLGYYDATEGGTQYYDADGGSVRVWDKAEGESFTLYAGWQVNTYTVVFDANGGEGVMDAMSFAYEESRALTANAYTRTGYTFMGWSVGANTGAVIYEDGAKVSRLTAEANGTVTLYAVWKPITYTIVFDGNGADSGEVGRLDMTYDVPAYLFINGYTKENYHFVGWATEATGEAVYTEVERVSNLAETEGTVITLYAVWKGNTYEVAFQPGSPDAVGTMENQSFAFGERKKLSKNLYTKEGCTFLGWSEAPDSLGWQYKDEEEAEDVLMKFGRPGDTVVNLYAIWQANTYTIILDTNKGDSIVDPVNPNTPEIGVTYGKPYPELAPLFREGYEFLGWYTEAEDGELVQLEGIVRITEDMTIYAHWSPKQYTISFDGNKGEGSSIPTQAASITVSFEGTYGALPVVSRDGYTFMGWYTAILGGEKIEPETKAMISENQTLYAQWEVNSYEVTFDANGGRFINGTTNQTESYSYDSTYDLPGIPEREGYTFTGWATTDGTIVTGDTPMTTAKNHTLKAQWKVNTYEVGFEVNRPADAAAEVKPATVAPKSVPYGTNYGELPEVALEGYEFLGWYTDNIDGTEITADSKFQVAGNQTLYAHWMPAERETVAIDGGIITALTPENLDTVLGAGSYTLDGTTVRLQKNLQITNQAITIGDGTSGMEVTLDLAGCKISGTTDNCIEIPKGATLTIKDSLKEGTIAYEGTNRIASVIMNKGTLNLESGIIEGTENGRGIATISGSTIEDASEVNMSGGEIRNLIWGIETGGYGSLNMTGGKITGCETGIDGNPFSSYGNIVISGGELCENGTAIAVKLRDQAYTCEFSGGEIHDNTIGLSASMRFTVDETLGPIAFSAPIKFYENETGIRIAMLQPHDVKVEIDGAEIDSMEFMQDYPDSETFGTATLTGTGRIGTLTLTDEVDATGFTNTYSQ